MKNIVVFVLFLFSNGFGFAQSSSFDPLDLFWQGEANNCASIALIKAAMDKFGYNKVFKEYEKKGEHHKVTLRDGKKFNISEEERLLAVKYAHWETPDEVKLSITDKEVIFYAYLAYACIAKYTVEEGYWGCEDENEESQLLRKMKNYERALNFISYTSYCADNCQRLLGLKRKDDKVFEYSNAVALNEKGTVLYSWGHAVAASNGEIDCYGNWISASEKICDNRFRWYIVVE